MSEHLIVIMEPDEPDWVKFPQPETAASKFRAGTIVKDIRGILWRTYWDEQDHALEWERVERPDPRLEIINPPAAKVTKN